VSFLAEKKNFQKTAIGVSFLAENFFGDILAKNKIAEKRQ